MDDNIDRGNASLAQSFTSIPSPERDTEGKISLEPPQTLALAKEYNDAIDILKRVIDKLENKESRVQDTRAEVEDCLTTLVTWGSDIRIDTEALEGIEGTAFELAA